MQGKILIVDPITTNRIVLKVKLSSAFYDVLQASNAADAFDIALKSAPDLVVTAITLPDGDAVKLGDLLGSTPETARIPILALGSLAEKPARMRVLEAGVQDVITGPADDRLLLGRVRSLIRAHAQASEWRMREDVGFEGFSEPGALFHPPGSTVIVTEDYGQAQGWIRALKGMLRGPVKVARPEDVLGAGPHDEHQSYVLVLPREMPGEMLQLLSALRAHGRTRNAGVLVLQCDPDPALGATALDLGADELMSEGFDASEMALRIRSMVRRKRECDALRASVRTGLNDALTDPLTGLHNRRYAMPQLTQIAERAAKTGRHFAVMLADLDHFKQVNDVYGHAAGDAVLTETAARLRSTLRSVDMIARIGGEEFLIVLPGAPLAEARQTASRLCRSIGGQSFAVPGQHQPIDVTISIGLTVGGGDACGPPMDAQTLLETADKALYAAKFHGRNQVTLSRPAA